MSNMGNIDELENATARLTCVTDMLASLNPSGVDLSEDGLNGLWQILHDVVCSLNGVSASLSAEIQENNNTKRSTKEKEQ